MKLFGSGLLRPETFEFVLDAAEIHLCIIGLSTDSLFGSETSELTHFVKRLKEKNYLKCLANQTTYLSCGQQQHPEFIVLSIYRSNLILQINKVI
ncbi:hypothetical protein A0J61_08458 [Choanephora cucurbitarum]|uniref:Uncharacterized protein n=1 Tax=Choanephora cucurbitarum TaxID=101091 RepID=A0A1C7N312_9FUNG|nr:hypothetical protein A0J61_08458 [Choanephora cucurbitarum]